MRELLRPGHVFVDVGANIGFFTNLGAHLVGRAGHVVAVEPLDKNVQLIYRSLERNGFNQVTVYVCAASDRAGLVSISTDSGTSNGQVLATVSRDLRVALAQARQLDDLTAGLERVDLVKLDIEGYELLAWRGFRRGLSTYRPKVLTEFHPHCMRKFVGVDPLEYLNELFSYGDSIQVLLPRGGRKVCDTPADVMHHWESANRTERADGKLHLDILVSVK
jgi:FkbM family methyltransferase